MRNSTEHEIAIAHKKLKHLKITLFLAFKLSDVVFILLIGVCWHFNIFGQATFKIS